MLISQILHTKGADVVCVAGDASIAHAVELLHRHRIGAVLVEESGQVVGVLSERDVVRALHSVGAGVLARTVRDCMSAPVLTVDSDDRVDAALAIMTERRFRHLPVLHGGALAGVVSIGDLVKARIDEAEREAAELKDYIAA